MRKKNSKSKILKFLSGCLAMLLMMSGIVTATPSVSYAAAGVVVDKQQAIDSEGRDPKFWVENNHGTNIAMCVNFNADTPKVGFTVGEPQLSNNDNLRKILYYGNSGPGDLGFTWSSTAKAASNALGNTPTAGSTAWEAVFNILVTQPTPPSTFEVYVVETTSQPGYQPLAYWINKPQGAAYIQKSSANTTITANNDCYSLKNAIYGIYSSSSCTDASMVTKLATDENGKTLTAPLDPGTYYVKEITAPKGYLLDKTVYPCVVVSGKTTAVAVKDVPGNDPVGIELTKIDKDTGETVQGAGDLSGAEFTVCYYDGYYNASNLPSLPTRKWVIKTKVDPQGHFITFLNNDYKISGDDFYYNNQNPCLPLGTITIEETKAPVGYTLEGAVFATSSGTPVAGKYVAQITSTNSGDVSLIGGNVLTVYDSVVRGDLEIYKTDFETGDVMANVRFRLTSKTTGESHEFVTDENGYYSTAASYIPHTKNTNGGNAGDGIYFGGAGADDSQGALPYDTYLLEEIPCEANEGKSMYSGLVEVNSTVVVTKSIANKDLTLTTQALLEDGSQYGAIGEDVVVTDTATYDGLTVGQEYVMKGIAMDKSTGKALVTADGKTVTAEKTFIPSAAAGTVSNAFSFNTTGLEGKDVVIFEEIYLGDLRIMSHTDLEDEAQTIHFPEIGTTLTDGVTGTHTSFATTEITLTDKVEYSGLEPGVEHTVTGILMDRETGEPALDDVASEITAEVTFIPETSDGTVEVTFTFSGLILTGKSVVAFEHVYRDGKEYAVHADINDEGQTVDFPKIHTTARDAETGIQNSYADEEITIIDTVTYENVEPGVEHILKGTLMDQTTGEPVTDSEGNAITAETVFTPEERNGEAEVTFVFDGTGREGSTYVVFEDLFVEEFKVATHADLEDEGQTIYIPEIKTTATDKESGLHIANADEKVTITDKVEYTNLIPEKEYTVSGVLYVKETGKELLVDGKPVTSEKTFVAEEAEGYVELDFTFNSSALKGQTTVAFETVKYDDITVAVHADIEDEDQSVGFPKVSTTATAGGLNGHTVTAGGEVTITDKVKYENLIPGKEYTVKGSAILKSTAKQLVVDGKEIKAELTFVPEEADGYVELKFTFSSEGLAGDSVVIFEEVYSDGVLIGSHSDLEDADQTIHFTENVITGDFPIVEGSLFAAFVLLVTGLFFVFRRKKAVAVE